MYRVYLIGGFVYSILLLPGCGGADSAAERSARELRQEIREEFGAEFPQPPIPENNPQTPEKVRLGEALFFDPNLSSCGTIACASCHLPEEGFSDGRRVSEGCEGVEGRRNSSALYNSAYLTHLFWDGRVQSLEQQALGPVVDPVEMSNTWDHVLQYLSSGMHPVTGGGFPQSFAFYTEYFDRVFTGEISSTTVAKALASYQRTVISRDSPFDRWLEGEDSALTPAQKKGARIFFGRGQCSECHPPPHFTDSDFHNVAVPRAGFEDGELFPENGLIGDGLPGNIDPGRAEVPFLRQSSPDIGRFRTPSLRNVELSAPYMHNGRFPTLEGVLQHYWNVGRGTAVPVAGEADPKVQLVMLTDFGGEPDDFINLLAFLKALTGTQVEGPDGGIAPPRLKREELE